MLKRVDNARVRYNRGLFSGTLTLWMGTGTSHIVLPARLSKLEYEQMVIDQQVKPITLVKKGGRTYWWFKDSCYWEADGLDADQVYALLVTRDERRQRQIQRAQAMVEQGPQESELRRGTISVEVRNYVFQRDGGQCVACRSKVELQFDHIIPVALGGSSDPANLQVLCGPCNRRKGASLG